MTTKINSSPKNIFDSLLIQKTNIISDNENNNSEKEKENENNSVESESNEFEIKSVRKSNTKNNSQINDKCNHEYFFNSYCTSNNKSEHGLLCYECLYKYHKDHISKCIPIRRKLYPKYMKYYKNCISNYKNKIEDICDRMEGILNHFLQEEIFDISDLFENKLNLNFELPIEVPIIDRIEMAVNNKLSYYFKNEINNALYKYLNLFKSGLDILKICSDNPNDDETIEFESTVIFDLVGIGIPVISKEEEKLINIKLYEEKKELTNQITFKDSNNNNPFCIGIFNSNPIKINNDTKYSLVISGIEGFNYIKKLKINNLLI